MTTILRPSGAVYTGAADAVRIVPLHVPAETTALAGAPAPQLTFRGGHLLTAVEVVTIFWGAAWDNPPQSALVQQINGFFDFILTSPLLDQLAEYSVSGQAIGHGSHAASLAIATPAPHRVASDKAIQHFLVHEIASNPQMPQSTPNTLYFVYLPPGVVVVQGGGRSCQVFCGYHNDINGQIFYAVMPYPGCNGCLRGLAPFDALTSVSSHELCEAITDPIPGQGWYDDHNGEIGDICNAQDKTVGAYTVQKEWSNRAGSCI